jgi:hypothetical protein
MDYKSKFSALELYIDGEWQFVDDINKINCERFNGSDQSITEQVSLLALPTK